MSDIANRLDLAKDHTMEVVCKGLSWKKKLLSRAPLKFRDSKFCLELFYKLWLCEVVWLSKVY